ncbi:hypothetical protein CAPTEDRAFT_208975, partial [Capitella teleta]
MAGIFSARPPSAGSGSNTSRKVVVQHRSDMLLEEQIRNVKNVQESLEQALVEVEAARSQQDVAFHQNTAKELEQRLKGMMLVVKIVHKVNNELVYARLDLQKALKEGSHANISKARKRIVKRPVELPWKPRRSGSELTDIHKTALNDLSADMNKMFDKVRDASLLSVNPTDLGDLKRPTLGTESSRISIMNRQKGIRMKLIAKCTKMFGFVIGVLVLLLDTLSRETPVQTLEEK